MYFSRKTLLRLAVTFLSIFAIVTIGCGGKKKSGSSSALRGGFANVSTTGHTLTNPLGECNKINITSMDFTGQVGTYYDPMTRAFVSNKLNLNITAVPDSIFSSSKTKIRFFRWSKRTSGARVVNQVPVKFYFADKQNGGTSLPEIIDTISQASLNTIKKNLGSTWLNVPLESIFSRVMIVLTGVEMDYDAMTVAFYDSEQSTSAVSTGNVLLPAFYSNPNTYSTHNPYEELYSLHPNYSTKTSNASESDYRIAIETICRDLAGIGARVPASQGASKPAAPSSLPEINEEPEPPQGFWPTAWQMFLKSLDAIGGGIH